MSALSTAPVQFVTGLPGNGKTLFAIWAVSQWAKRENRQVYYHGIEILDKAALPWVELENPEDWHKCPHGAIILIDEAHKTFPNRPTGSKVPPHVEPIAELRHQGHSLILITQHPMEIDSAVRRRCGRHMNVVRPFGLQKATVYEWPKVKENCDKSNKDAVATKFSYPKEVFGWYKSAEVHTIKRSIPLRVWLLLLVPVVLAVAVYVVVNIFLNQRAGKNVGAVAPANADQVVQPVQSGQANGAAMTPAQYVESMEPRVRGLAYTAPAYDKVTTPVRAPYPAACVANKSRCQCYTQQGTKLDVPNDMCRSIAEGGFFMAWDDAPSPRAQQAQAQPAKPPAETPYTQAIPLSRRQVALADTSPAVVEQDPARPRVRR
ncbi:MAG: zonular occludens toxin domain-containing protein [Aquabacterium sp.]|uniref:zonular occludens toxin domain-containing protein n=1 Tax=Aquabacterium sp. TaxID=1872578 RepID=UPI003BD70725